MSSYYNLTAGAVEHCESMAALHPDLSEHYRTIGDLCHRKLWHQMTLKVIDFFSSPSVTLRATADGTSSFLALYDRLVLVVSKKLNPLSLARMASLVSDSLEDTDGIAARTVLENLLLEEKQKQQQRRQQQQQQQQEQQQQDQRQHQSSASSSSSSGGGGGGGGGAEQRLGMSATLFLQSKLGLLQLNLLERQQQQQQQQQQQGSDDTNASNASIVVDADGILAKIKEQLKRNESLLGDEMSRGGGGVGAGGGAFGKEEASIVHSAHYACGMKYHKAVGPPEAFYRQAMQYLNYTPLGSIPNPHQLAVDLSLSALTGEGVYNLGQVLSATPLLTRSLTGTEDEYLLDLLGSMSSGNVSEFNALSARHAVRIQSQPALMNRRLAVQEKMSLLALVTMVWERPASQRTLTFAEIARRVLQMNVPDGKDHIKGGGGGGKEDEEKRSSDADDVDADDDDDDAGGAASAAVELLAMRALSLGLIEGSLDQVDGMLEVTWVMPRVLSREQMNELALRFGEWAVKVSQLHEHVKDQTTALLAS